MIMNILSVLFRGLNYQALIFISYSLKLKTTSDSEHSLPVTAGVERKQLRVDPCFQHNLACFNTLIKRAAGGKEQPEPKGCGARKCWNPEPSVLVLSSYIYKQRS